MTKEGLLSHNTLHGMLLHCNCIPSPALNPIALYSFSNSLIDSRTIRARQITLYSRGRLIPGPKRPLMVSCLSTPTCQGMRFARFSCVHSEIAQYESKRRSQTTTTSSNQEESDRRTIPLVLPRLFSIELWACFYGWDKPHKIS